MKKIDLGQTIAILANLGVIAGIAFLAVEMQQNNRLLTAQAEFGQLQYRQDHESIIIENPDFADLFVRSRAGEELTSAENLRIFRYVLQQFQALEWEYLQNRTGALNNLEKVETRIGAMFLRPDFFGTTPDGLSTAWSVFSGNADSQFVQLVEDVTRLDE